MSRRCFVQPSLARAFVKAYSRSGGFLEEISRTFERGSCGVLFARINGAVSGAPGYPPLVMFEIVLLRQWYNLSGPAAEEAVRDRLPFRRFCGIPLDQETPDHASIWQKLGLAEKLLAEVNPRARRARIDRQARHAGWCDNHRSGSEAAASM